MATLRLSPIFSYLRACFPLLFSTQYFFVVAFRLGSSPSVSCFLFRCPKSFVVLPSARLVPFFFHLQFVFHLSLAIFSYFLIFAAVLWVNMVMGDNGCLFHI